MQGLERSPLSEAICYYMRCSTHRPRHLSHQVLLSKGFKMQQKTLHVLPDATLVIANQSAR